MKTLRIPGGLSLSLSGLYDSEGYHRAMDQLGAATAPLKAVLDLLTFALGIKRVLEAAPAIPVDPAVFISRLREITVNATKLLALLPQVSLPVLVQDMCGALIDLVQLVRDEVAAAQLLADAKATVDAAVSLDPALAEVSVQIAAQQQVANAALAEMLEPLILVGGIVDTFLEILGVTPLGLTAEMTANLDELDALLAGIQDTLRRIA